MLRVGAFVALIDDHVLLVAQGRIDNRVRGRACQATPPVPCATRRSHFGSHCRTIARRHCQAAFVLLAVVLTDRGAAGLACGGKLVGCILLDRGRLEEVLMLRGAAPHLLVMETVGCSFSTVIVHLSARVAAIGIEHLLD